MFPVAATDAADTDPDVDIEPPVIAPVAVIIERLTKLFYRQYYPSMR